MKAKRTIVAVAVTILLLAFGASLPRRASPPHQIYFPLVLAQKSTNTPVPTVPAKASATHAPTPTGVPTPTPAGEIAPFPSAPLCPDHNPSVFHTLWDGGRGCHYDHEHGKNPFTPEVAASFPGFDLQALLGGVQIGHTNPSSPIENVAKHGGFKWQVDLAPPNGSQLGFEGATVAVCAYAVQWHAYGNYSVEFEGRIHSAAALFKQCVPDSTDYGYVYVVQHLDFGERSMGYQGVLLRGYPDNPSPAYDPAFAPYWTADCFGPDQSDPVYPRTVDCRATRTENRNATTTWTSDPRNLVGSGSKLLTLLFRARDTYQLLDSTDLTHPYSWRWICSNDEGLTYVASPGCRYNNTTTTLHQLEGTIPAAWDNLAGFDTETESGRITATGFVTRFGELNLACTAPGPDCFPIKMVRAMVGNYGSFLIPLKISAFSREALPERDIYFDPNGNLAMEDPFGVNPSSGWTGPNN